jgi:hypothetical protein
MAALAVVLAGCPAPDPMTGTRASTVLETSLRSGVFLKAGDAFTVTVDGAGVVNAQFGPRQISRYADEANPTVTFLADEFPEGGATMEFTLQSWWWNPLEVEQVWIDRTAPVLIRVENPVVGLGGNIELLLWDAVALDRAEIQVGEQRFEYPLPRETATSQVTRVALPASELSEGELQLSITVWDAAGNELQTEQTVVVDFTPPQVQFTAPQQGAVVSGQLELQVSAADNVQVRAVELRANGSLVAVLGGGQTTVTIDTGVFPRGELLLEARATDTAGNVGATAQVTVEVL